MNVIVTAYNPNWPALYEQEAQAIRQILGKELIAIHHIGSTSVPGLFAKPIIDIMPVVAHIETVVLLSKLKVDHHIEIEIKMDELDLTAAESKATYDEIKAYVLDKYGLKVSQLYIAQVKRKCGIIERKNYNVSKKEDAKVPQCPPEKEAAIMDALKHFQMI